MPKKVVATILVLVIISAAFVVSEPAHGLDFNIIRRVVNAIRAVANLLKSVDTARVTFPFGGKITDTGVACKIHYWTTVRGCPPVGVCYVGPGIPIPITGTKIDVDRPGIPADDIFTFPFISQIYANKNQNKVGVWTLGLAFNNEFFERGVLNPINDALDQIPVITIGVADFYNFSLSCPEGGVIYKIGTSD
ncbi:MAG: hypothetical protein WD989_02495 [Candidatus Paceibacterota bacterium]